MKKLDVELDLRYNTIKLLRAEIAEIKLSVSDSDNFGELKEKIIEDKEQIRNSKLVNDALKTKLKQTLDELNFLKKNVPSVEGENHSSSSPSFEVTQDMEKRYMSLDDKLKKFTVRFSRKDQECTALRMKLKEAAKFCADVAEAKPTYT
jgi:uncharacterized protein involved in exopolysaccharide biosynthesis